MSTHTHTHTHTFLQENFPECFDKNGSFLIEKFTQLLKEQAVDFSTESYGLQWLGKSYAHFLGGNQVPTTTLIAGDKVHNALPENTNSQNLLIKGDNLEVLKHLKSAYSRQVKMIYIDPPYNTGSDGFVYQDDKKFTKEQLIQLADINPDEADRILKFTSSGSNSHSAWLTFMYPRLHIAKSLLKDDGVIFVSIDDNEVAQLRLLMNEVFNENNVEEMVWKKVDNDSGKLKITHRFRTEHEYILVGYKNKETTRFHKYLSERNYKNTYTNPDNDIRGPYKQGIISTTEEKSKQNGKNFYSVVSPSGKIFSRQWRFDEAEFKRLNEDGRIYFGKKGDSVPAIKVFINEEGETTPMSILENFGTAKTAGAYLNDLFNGQEIFNYPKPVPLAKNLLQIGTNQSDLILDFFAGSGTTGDAVMQLNAADGGNRKYILVQWPEAIDAKKNAVAYNFVKEELKAEPTIFEITKERLKRAAAKIRKERADLFADGQKIDLGFQVFETLATPAALRMEEMVKLDSQQQLFQEAASEAELEALLQTWKLQDGILLTEKGENIDLDGYKAHYCKQRLYLLNVGFGTNTLKCLLEKIDADSNFNPKTIIVFNPNFESERLREISENLRLYANKKGLDIDFLSRFSPNK